MAHISYNACDKCGKKIVRPRVTLTVNYHHPRKLEFCGDCEGLFALWLGKHPLWDNDDFDRASGDGYPSKDQLTTHRWEQDTLQRARDLARREEERVAESIKYAQSQGR